MLSYKCVVNFIRNCPKFLHTDDTILYACHTCQGSSFHILANTWWCVSRKISPIQVVCVCICVLSGGAEHLFTCMLPSCVILVIMSIHSCGLRCQGGGEAGSEYSPVRRDRHWAGGASQTPGCIQSTLRLRCDPGRSLCHCPPTKETSKSPSGQGLPVCEQGLRTLLAIHGLCSSSWAPHTHSHCVFMGVSSVSPAL